MHVCILVIHMYLHSVYYHCNMKFSILSYNYARVHGDYKVIARIYKSGYIVIFNRIVQKPCLYNGGPVDV